MHIGLLCIFCSIQKYNMDIEVHKSKQKIQTVHMYTPPILVSVDFVTDAVIKPSLIPA